MVRAAGDTWGTWFNGGAQTSTDPKIAALGNGSDAVVIVDAGGAVWSNTFSEGTGNGWQPWTNVGGAFSDVAPVGVSGGLFFVGKALNNDQVVEPAGQSVHLDRQQRSRGGGGRNCT
jgi:hypothetical protein